MLKKFGKKNDFFKDQISDFTIKNSISLKTPWFIAVKKLKAGDYGIYLNYVLLGQIILANNCPPDLDNYV